jgi:hypothetical protein
MGFEPTIPASKRAKTVHALDRAATVIVDVRRIPVCKTTLCREDYGKRCTCNILIQTRPLSFGVCDVNPSVVSVMNL